MFTLEKNGDVLDLSFAVGEQSAFELRGLSQRGDAKEWTPAIQRLKARLERSSHAKAERFAGQLRENGINPSPDPPAAPLADADVDPMLDPLIDREQWMDTTLDVEDGDPLLDPDDLDLVPGWLSGFNWLS
jgi:hypothetical protein